jgi:transposase, IS5 family
MRVDSTAVETDVHDPSDASLLWDGMRIITRWLDEGYTFNPRPDYRYYDHLRVAKKRLLAVINAKKEADRVSAYRDLVHYADKVVGYHFVLTY